MKKEFLTRLSVCVSLSFSLLFWCLDFLKFYSFFHMHRKIQHFSTHTREKKRKEEKRDSYFSHPTLHTHFFVHTQKTLKTHKREREIISFVVSVPHTLFRLFLSLSLSSFEKKVWRTRRNVRRSWKPGERN